MSIENPWFTTRFSKEDYASVALLRYGCRGYRKRHFEPLLPSPKGKSPFPEQIQIRGCSGVHDDVRFSRIEVVTARWEFLGRALGVALGDAQTHFPDLNDVQWVPCLPNWLELVLPTSHSDSASFAEERLRAICASGEIVVETGVRVEVREPFRDGNEAEEARTSIRVVVDAERLSDDVILVKQSGDQTGRIHVPSARCSFAYDEVQEFVARPSSLQLELLNHWEATPPATQLERQMIAAASDLRIGDVQTTLRAGADINALDESDETALAVAAISYREYNPTREHVVCRLVELGADVNLFGYDGQDPLLSATFSAEPALVEFLLRAGADPNHSPYPEDEPDLISAALDIAVTDAFLERGTPAGDGCEAIVRLLDEAGAVIGR